MLRDIRNNYQKFELKESEINKDPIKQLNDWLNEAIKEEVHEPNAMVLSTIDTNGNPDSRVVLLKDINAEGLVFFTNYNSKKGRQITNNPNVSVDIFWPQMQRQVRIKGKADKISEEDSSEYFRTRPDESKLGAWASPQSRIIENRNVLNESYKKYEQYFENHEIQKPSHWGGYLIRPKYFEFWQGRPNRLHDRLEYILDENEWIIHRLAP